MGKVLTCNYNHARAILSCKDLPAALEARRDRKLMIENLRTSLCLELAEKNTSVVEKVCCALSSRFYFGVLLLLYE